MGQKLFIRADATTAIGIGHIMRCIALAQAWQKDAGDVTFVTACQSNFLHRRLLEEGFQVITLEKPYPHPDDWQVMSRALKARPVAWIVLDGYHLDTAYQRRMKESGHRVMIIDDTAHLDYYVADILLNQNINAEKLSYSCDPNTRLLLGTEYVLLRSEFLAWRNWRRETPEVARRILVTLGGGDPHNVTLQVIKALKMISTSDLEVKITVGASNPHAGILKDALPPAPSNMSMIHNIKNMADLMAWADAAVSAGGSTCWEMCFMKLPLATIILADNQQRISEGVERTGIGICCGWYYELDVTSLAKRFANLIHDRDCRSKMSEKAGELVDGLGTKRTIDKMAAIG
jgi:UDP-2,4-diacetamido-2,4,6-trideoxy-beta-L-altropyranose hydrolase